MTFIYLYILCLDSVRFHYTLLDVCAEFSCVYGTINNRRMLFYKIAHIFTRLDLLGRSRRLYNSTGWTMGQAVCLNPDPSSGPLSRRLLVRPNPRPPAVRHESRVYHSATQSRPQFDASFSEKLLNIVATRVEILA